jgi:hypothetical protein
MVIAWVFFASVGMIVARYYKDLLPTIRVRGVAFWFVLHVPLMFMVPVFSVIALILILVELNGQWVDPEDRVKFIHSVFGIVTIIMTIVQVKCKSNLQ